MTRDDTVRREELPWLLGICLLALVLRLYALDAQLWYDEILTLVEFVRLPTRELLTTYTSLNNHMLFSLEAQASIAAFGEHAWSLRLPAALFGVGSVAMAYYVVREAVGPWEARFSTLLLALSYHHIWFSQNARGYTGLFFFSLAATWIFVRAERHRSFRPWVLYGVAVALAGYTHLTAALFFASHGIVLVWLYAERWLARRRGRPAPPPSALTGRAPWIGLGLGAGLTALLHASLVPQMLAAFTKVTGAPAVHAAKAVVRPSDGQWKNPLWTVLEVVRGFGDLGPLLVVGLPFAIGFVIAGGVSLCRKNRVLTAVYLVNIPFTLLVLVAAGFRLWPRYFFLDMAFLLWCVARGLFVSVDFLVERGRGGPLERLAKIGGYLAVGGAIVASLLLLPKNYRFPKQDFRGALELVQARRGRDGAVAVVGLAALPYTRYYSTGWTVVNDAAELEALREQPGPTFVVYSFSGHARSRFPDVMAVVEREFSRLRKFQGTLGDGDVFVMQSER